MYPLEKCQNREKVPKSTKIANLPGSAEYTRLGSKLPLGPRVGGEYIPLWRIEIKRNHVERIPIPNSELPIATYYIVYQKSPYIPLAVISFH
jgi:hypothetical protein